MWMGRHEHSPCRSRNALGLIINARSGSSRLFPYPHYCLWASTVACLQREMLGRFPNYGDRIWRSGRKRTLARIPRPMLLGVELGVAVQGHRLRFRRGYPSLRRLIVHIPYWFVAPATTEWTWTVKGRLDSAPFGYREYPRHAHQALRRRMAIVSVRGY